MVSGNLMGYTATIELMRMGFLPMDSLGLPQQYRSRCRWVGGGISSIALAGSLPASP